MKRVFCIFMILCLAILGYQDMVHVDTSGTQLKLSEATTVSSAQEKIESKFIQENKALTFYYDSNEDYIQTLCRISQGHETHFSSLQVRLFHKYISGFLLKNFNCKQKISELVSTSQTIAQSSLNNRNAHVIYMLQKIVI